MTIGNLLLIMSLGLVLGISVGVVLFFITEWAEDWSYKRYKKRIGRR